MKRFETRWSIKTSNEIKYCCVNRHIFNWFLYGTLTYVLGRGNVCRYFQRTSAGNFLGHLSFVFSNCRSQLVLIWHRDYSSLWKFHWLFFACCLCNLQDVFSGENSFPCNHNISVIPRIQRYFIKIDSFRFFKFYITLWELAISHWHILDFLVCFQWIQSKCLFSISAMVVGKLLQFLDVFLGICEHAPDKNNQCHRIFEVLNSTGKLAYISCKNLLKMISDWLRPRLHGYVFIWKHKDIVVVLPPVHTETMKTIVKTQKFNTQSEGDRSENATKWKRNDLKKHPCNRVLIRLEHYLNLEATERKQQIN